MKERALNLHLRALRAAFQKFHSQLQSTSLLGCERACKC